MKDRILLYVILIIVIGLSAWMVKKEFSNEGVAYIDIGKLVDGYQLKKDLEAVTSKDLYSIKHTIDSLEMIRKTIGATNHTSIDTQIARAKYVFDEYYKSSNNEISHKIWERLNPVIEEYGKEHNLQILIGANGAGTLLYADTKRDMTNDLLKYVNNKYEKGH